MIVSKKGVIRTDVLVIGGGLGGCIAAIKAKEQGATVVLMEKAAISRSGNAATGLHRIPLIAPDFNMSAEEFASKQFDYGEIVNEDLSYIFAKESYGIIKDLESYGIRCRLDDESFMFEWAPDILFPGKIVIYPPEGQTFKPKLAQVVRDRGVRLLERTMAITLLTREGQKGLPVIGAIGINTRTGEFVVVQSKATILTTGGGYRLYRHRDSLYAPSRNITAGCPANVGEGVALAYRAGAEILNMELLKQSPVWKDYEHWGVGPIAYRHGSKVIDYSGAPLYPDMNMKTKTWGWLYAENVEGRGPIHYDLTYLSEEAIKDKELALKMECEAYFVYIKARNIDLRKKPIEFENHPPYLHNCQAGVSISMDGRTTLEGLYAAGDCHGGGWRFSSMGAFVFGALSGKNGAEVSKKIPPPEINWDQVRGEKARIERYTGPAKGIEPFELEDKIRKTISDYAGFLRNEGKLKRGLERLAYFKETFFPKMVARNVRELKRAIEVDSILLLGEMHLRAALFRKETRICPVAVHYRIDYPETDNINWRKHTVLRQGDDGTMEVCSRPLRRLKDISTEDNR
ncbi:MAG: FAD-dependent oxidoreductase [Deltaproteobacteria bacterium]|nr:FAD-dependent oxidoreductase [Deltaproteobacteria bacterium]